MRNTRMAVAMNQVRARVEGRASAPASRFAMRHRRSARMQPRRAKKGATHVTRVKRRPVQVGPIVGLKLTFLCRGRSERRRGAAP